MCTVDYSATDRATVPVGRRLLDGITIRIVLYVDLVHYTVLYN